MHIAIFNQHHHNPDCPSTCRHYTFLEYLAKRHKVSLVTSSAWKQLRITDRYKWVPDGVDLYEQEVPYSNKMGVRRRLVSYGGFAAYSLAKGLSIPKPDVVWGVSTPLSTPWMAARVAKMRGIPWVFEVQDLWPSFPIEMGAVKKEWLKRRLFRLEKNLYQNASHIITLSPDMEEYVVRQGIARDKVSTILNGTDLEMADAATPERVAALRKQYQLQGKQVVLYAGTFGRANDIPTIMQAAEAMANQQDIVFVLAGGGYYDNELRKLSLRLPNLVLMPPQPRPDVFTLFKLADLALITFNDLPVLASNSPAKLYDSLACGVPVLVTNPGWTKTFVEQHNCGWYSPASQPELLAKKIKEIMADREKRRQAGANGQSIARQLFDRQQLAAQVEQVLLQVTGKV
ncbi:glycosyltransferase family 4 protein [Pontibacter lucknowensis]|uniref:Glycosyltransferase involved in cell wall bisynthesis n=1 Tax=Pontibacter lucknowensis TaxID=1077936 RepID=A0A1N7BC25_9BACT|nr:glycosyltransferase family 4 protein [Pontibacter lucknowensis]SIR48882.1 Glycosyltransferase involved in cell wall bisynthesis [Pontibacter lucknowensis]